MCLSCAKTLGSRDLIPVASFFLLGGRCRHCKSKISWQYPLVEIATGILFVFSFFHAYKILPTYLAVFDGVSLFIICSVFVIIFVYDLRHKIINNLPVIILCFVAIIRILVTHLGDFGSLKFFLDLISGPAAALPFFLIWLLSRGKWMGLGDAKLMLGIGPFVGWALWPPSMILGFWIGVTVIIVLVLLQIISKTIHVNYWRKLPNLGLKTEVPFGPFLILAALISFFFNFNVLSAVLGFFL